MKHLIISLLMSLVAAVPVFGQEFHVVASRTAAVRQDHDINAEPIVRLHRGDAASSFVDPQTGQPEQEDRFYHIRLADGRTGWVSRYTVRAHEGPVPGAVPGPDESPVEVASREFHLEIGKPESYVELVNEGYIVGYDQRLKIPAWVQYRVTGRQLSIDRPRSNAFAPDERIVEPGRSSLIDYEVAGSWDVWTALGLQPPSSSNAPSYARGHMAPARDMARTEAIEESSYLLSNMAPQIHNGYNNGIWSSLERRVRQWVEARGELTIIMGPVFLSSERLLTPEADEDDRLGAVDQAIVLAQPPTERQVIYNVVGDNEVAVPTAFFKVVVDQSDFENPEILAFLIPHYRASDRDLEDLLVSVDEIEALTGLDLLTGFRNEVQNRVEAVAADRLW